MRFYGTDRNMTGNQIDAEEGAAVLHIFGTRRRPEAPRDVTPQSGEKRVFISWKLPVRHDDIAGWNVYKDTENNFYCEVSHKANRQIEIPATGGAAPPQNNYFICSRNAAGVESRKVQVQGKAAVDAIAGAPANPSPSVPPGYTSESSGGADRTYRSGSRTGIQS